MAFLRENLSKLENENMEHMPIGFEIAFPSLLDVARGLNVEVPHDSPILKRILALRNVKLTRYTIYSTIILIIHIQIQSFSDCDSQVTT